MSLANSSNYEKKHIINSSFAIQQLLLPPLTSYLVLLFFVDSGVVAHRLSLVKLMMRPNGGVAQCNSFADCPMEFVEWPLIDVLWSSLLLMVMASILMPPTPWIVLVYANFILQFIGISIIYLYH